MFVSHGLRKASKNMNFQCIQRCMRASKIAERLSEQSGLPLRACITSMQRQIHKSATLEKRQSPRTVGIPAWKKAAIDRKQHVTKLRKPKSEETVRSEIRLEMQEKELSFYTTTRIRNVPKHQETDMRLKPEVFLSKDESMLICYHPAPQYPKEKTRESWERPVWYGDKNIQQDYCDELTKEQEIEAKKLLEADAKLWTPEVLANMLKVKPSVISERLPLTSDQIFEKEVERKLLSEWSKSRRLDYKKYQNLEILEYIRNTRGEPAVVEYRRKLNI